MTREEFSRKLNCVDFFYEYLENFEQYERAYSFYSEVLADSKVNLEFKVMFDSAREKIFG